MNAVILQNDLAKLAEWEQLWGMEFHPQKYSYLKISKNLEKQKHTNSKRCHPSRGNFNKIPWRRHPIKSGVE